MAAGAVLKSLYPKLLHVTCCTFIAQLCYEVKTHFENVDQLIIKVKSPTAETKLDKLNLLLLVSCLSLLQRRSWLHAALYGAKNLSYMKVLKSLVF